VDAGHREWRFVRNIHPANVFYLPMTAWQRVGADPTLIASVAAFYRQRYANLRSEFSNLAGGVPSFGLAAPDGELAIEPTVSTALTSRNRTRRTPRVLVSAGDDVWGSGPAFKSAAM
jgi:hypothetical protein